MRSASTPAISTASNPEQTIRLVGELLRMSTDGLFRMLDMRSQLKSELHIEDRTMIASRENNPLKHADSPHDAIAYLVDLRQHGNRLFMPPGKAVEDTIWDICAHEMAVMAGTRAALLAALKMFSPEVIEGRIKKTGALENRAAGVAQVAAVGAFSRHVCRTAARSRRPFRSLAEPGIFEGLFRAEQEAEEEAIEAADAGTNRHECIDSNAPGCIAQRPVCHQTIAIERRGGGLV